MKKEKLTNNNIFINTAALAENYKIIQKFVGNKVSCAANIKSDAYGFGMMNIMRSLSVAGCNRFFVSTIDDALEIRNFSLTDEIYVLNGIFSGEEEYFARNNIIPVLNTIQEFDIYNNYCRKKNRNFHAVLNIETGINIIGIPYKEALELKESGYFNQNIVIKFILSYFDSERQENDQYIKLQIEKLKYLKNTFKVPVSFSGSSGIDRGKEYHFDIVRPGISLFGFSKHLDIRLFNVITLVSKIVQIHGLKEKSDKITATICIGSDSGILKSLSNKAAFDINGYMAPVIGKITSDYIILDVTHIPKDEIYIGAEVEILGKNATIQKMSDDTNSSYKNIICSLSSRIKRIYR